MLTYTLDANAKQPLYEQLYRHIRRDISEGELKKDMKLPSKRALASHLSISVITVEAAYAQLIMEGYIISKPRSGFYVADVGEYPGLGYSGSSASDGVSGKGKGEPKREWFADFTSNQTSPDDFPFVTWAKLSRTVLLEYRDQLMENPPSGGCMVLREAIAGYLSSFRGLNVRPEQIIVGAGTEYLYSLLLQLFGRGKTYANEDPGYQKVSAVFRSFDASCVSIGLDSDGIRIPPLLDNHVDVVHVTPSHHFPTGIVMPAGRRSALLKWASECEGRYIIEDDYDSEFRMDGKPMLPLAAMDRHGRVVYVNTFTKSLASTIRISYMVLPPELLLQFERKLGFYSCTVSTFEQYTLAMFIREGYFEKHLNRMRNSSRKKRDLLLSEIRKSALGEHVSILEKNAGLHFLMNLSMNFDSARLTEEAGEAGIRLTSLERYLNVGRENIDALTAMMGNPGIGDPGHTFIINYSSLRTDRIEGAVRRLEQLFIPQ